MVLDDDDADDKDDDDDDDADDKDDDDEDASLNDVSYWINSKNQFNDFFGFRRCF